MRPRVVADFDELLAALRARRHELRLSQEVLSEIAGLPDRYANTLECGRRRLGPISLPALIGALRLRLIVWPDDRPLPDDLADGADEASSPPLANGSAAPAGQARRPRAEGRPPKTEPLSSREVR